MAESDNEQQTSEAGGKYNIANKQDLIEFIY